MIDLAMIMMVIVMTTTRRRMLIILITAMAMTSILKMRIVMNMIMIVMKVICTMLIDAQG